MPFQLLIIALALWPGERPAASPSPITSSADLDGDGVREVVRFYLAADGERGFLARDAASLRTSPIYPAWKALPARFSGERADVMVLGVWTSKRTRPGEPKRKTIWVVGIQGSGWVERWRGSALARPFDDFALADLDGDGADELVVSECADPARSGWWVYRWNGFGFSGAGRLRESCDGAPLDRAELRRQRGR